MPKCLFAIIRSEQLKTIAKIDLDEHHSIDPDFEVPVPTKKHWDEERWLKELSRKEFKGVVVTEGAHTLGAFIYEVTEDGYKLIRCVTNTSYSSEIKNFFDYALLWLVDKTYREGQPTLSVLVDDDNFDTLKAFSSRLWHCQSERNYLGDELDYWVVTFRNKKVYREKV